MKALSPAAALKAIDIGTGAGLPGIPVSLVHPEWRMTLVESIQKKCSFLVHMKELLALNTLTVMNERVEVLGQSAVHREQYDLVLSRAVAKLIPNLEIALPLLRQGGTAIIYKTERSVPQGDELAHVNSVAARLGGKLTAVVPYRLPHEEQGYALLLFEKQSATPAAYPRRPGVPEKKPL